jgi:hypothetical protein
MNALIAEAEAEAARLRQEILVELAKKTKVGNVEFENKTGPAPPAPENLHEVPDAPIVSQVAPRIEPEHVAEFRSSLARVMREQVRADAQQTALEATFAERRSSKRSRPSGWRSPQSSRPPETP